MVLSYRSLVVINPLSFITSIEESVRHVQCVCIVSSVITAYSPGSVELTDRFGLFNKGHGWKLSPLSMVLRSVGLRLR